MVWLLLVLAPNLHGQKIRIELNEAALDFGSVKVQLSDRQEHLLANSSSKELAQILQVFPLEAWQKKKGKLPPMFGRHEIRRGQLLFIPRFPFRQGGEYVVKFSLESDAPMIQNLQIPTNRRAFANTTVRQVYPTGDRLPANLLKLYIHFSNPMGQQNVYDFLELVDVQTKQKVADPFLELSPALWDSEQKRLTIWFDPGRIKRHLYPNVSLGPPLEQGRHYQLRISKEWPDAFGQPLGMEYTKQFYVTAADRQQPDPITWSLEVGTAGLRDSVILRFPESIDRAMLESGIAVMAASEEPVRGSIHISERESAWSFVPEEPWSKGRYEVRYSLKLEDLAGNNLNRLFDQSTTDTDGKAIHHRKLTFIIE